MKKQNGAAVLLIVIILMISVLLTMSYVGNNGAIQLKSGSNSYNGTQATNAALAGLDYGFAYLKSNTATVVAAKVSNAISLTLATVTMSNGASYTVTYTSPVNNFTVITITSVGRSSGNVTTSTMSQKALLKAGGITTSAVTRGALSLIGGSTLSNLQTNLNIKSGGAVTINNGGYTITSSGTTSSQGNYGADLQQNVAALSSLNDASFFQTVFGVPQATVKTASQTAGTYYNNSVPGGDYSQTLSNKQGVTVWIDQNNVSLGQGVTIGSPASPVTLIVNGNSLTIANGVTFYGFVYMGGASGNSVLNLAGGAKITGGISSSGSISMSNGFQLIFNAVPVTGSGTGGVSKVPGSLKNF